MEILRKIGRFCENHVEKIVLVLVSGVCVWLFFTRVIFSPNVVPLDNRTFAPGQIDRHIYEQKIPELRAKLQEKKSGAARPYTRRFDGPISAKDPVVDGILNRALPQGFAGLFDSPLSFISTASVSTPGTVPQSRLLADRKYRLPLIPDVTDVGVSYMRAAAYVPLEELTVQTTYDKVAVEPNDIDLVTVEGRFDVAELYRRFQASFNGVDVLKEEWRDPCLAKPIFAAVQLERQELQENGAWGDWQPVPRSRVESNRELFKVVDRLENLPPGGLEVRLMQFNQEHIATGLLQPESYQIASAEEDWFPPSFYSKFKDLQRKVETEEKRAQRDQDRKQNERTGTDPRREGMNRGGTAGGAYGGATTGTGRTTSRRGTTGGMPGDSMYGGNPRANRSGRVGGATGPGSDPMMGGRPTRGRGRAGANDPLYGGDMTYGMMGDSPLNRKPTTNQAYWEFSKEIIGYREDLSKREKPVLFWVFDDTVEPGKMYQYRVRLGVFNPVAGTGQLSDRDTDKKDQVILWSRHSEVTKPVEVQKRVYLFAKDVQEKTNTATVEVARYALGYWRSESFQVRPGEVIGREMEPKKEEDKDRIRARMAGAYGYPPAGPGGRITDMAGAMGPGMPGYMPPSPDQQNMPKTVNYNTGKVLVDLVPVNDWGHAPNLRPRMYHDMLYTGDGTHIEHMPVSATNWPKDLASAYQLIQTEKHREPQPFRAFNKSGLRGRGGRGAPGMPEGYEDMGMYDDMGMYEGGGMYPY